MLLPSQRWLKVVVLATALVFLGVAVYLYGLRFSDWIESDAAVTAVLAAKALQAKLPVVGDWYYANGDVWVLTPHLLAVLPVALLGLGPASLLVAVVTGLVLEIFACAWVYARLCGERWVAVFAALVTLMAWSRAHVAFAYIQLAYGWAAVMFLIGFGALATLAADPPAPRRRWLAASGYVALVVLSNPTRQLVFVLAPLVVGCLWPWPRLDLRRRLALLAAVTLGWLVATIVYTVVFPRVLSFAYPPGHIDFAIKDVRGVVDNLRMLGRGLQVLCGGYHQLGWRAVPGALVMLGAVTLVCREVVAARTLTALRFVCVVVTAQLGCVLVPLVIGNLLISPDSVRYAMPSLMAMFGLATLLAVRAVGEAARGWRWLATGWLVLVPITALLATPHARPPKPRKYAQPDVLEFRKLGPELARRGFVHGYANMLNANILNLESHGRSLTCPIYFAHVLIPQRWLADTSCYTASALPDRFYIVADHDERDAAALAATLPPPIERFHVGETYEVSVFRTAEVSLAWLELPIHDGDELRFPLRLPATHLAFHRGHVALEAGRLAATGEPGHVLFGPYLRLPAGAYRVVWRGGGIASPGDLTYTVAADLGRDVLARATVPARAIGADPTTLVELTFVTERTRETVEFPILSADGARVALDELVIERR